MAWIDEAIKDNAVPVLERVSQLLEEVGDAAGYPVSREEMMKQAEVTVELLPGALSGSVAPLLKRWESFGRLCAERGITVAELPGTNDVVKRAIWGLAAEKVEGGEAQLSGVVDAMMEVESVLSRCHFALVHSFLAKRDEKMVARAERMEELHSLTELLSSESESYRIYRSIVDSVAGITGISRCSLLIFNRDGVLEVVASNYAGTMDQLRDCSIEELAALLKRVARGEPAVVEKAGSSPEIRRVLDAYGTPVVLALPMRSGEKDLGLLLLDEGKAGEFTPDQVEMAVSCASQAAIAVEKSGLLEKMESRLKGIAAIGIVARTMTSSLDLKEQLDNLLNVGTTIVRADRGAVMLTEEMFGKLDVAASTPGFDEDCTRSGVLKEVVDWVAEHREPVVLHRGEEDPRFPHVDPKANTCMSAPLMVRGKIIGVVTVASDRAGERFGTEDIEMFGNFAAQAAVSIENTQLYERLQDTYLGAIGSLAAAIEARDPYTVGHSARVTQYAVAIAEAMNLHPDEVEELRLAGILHDLGKIGVPDSILNKPGRLSEEEYMAIKMHPALSMRIIEPLPHLGNIIPIIYHHHESFDGSGYIDGKQGDGIPLGARIIAVADAFEAMTSDRPYRTARTREEAMQELRRNAGSQFDPEVVGVFLDLLEETAK